MVGAGRSQAVHGGPVPEDDEIEADPGPSYTWLHYVILVVVAFVLGFLIWKLVLEEDPSPSADEAAQLIVSVLPGAGLA